MITIAGSMFAATGEVGDQHGPYIGETTGPNRSPVHFDPFTAAQRNRPTVISVTGEPGGGKTHTAELLAYQMALRGAWVLDIDPKGDHEGLMNLPGIGNARVLKVSGHNAGLLDPFALADDPEEGAMLALETLRLLLPPGIGFEREGALVTACKNVADRDRPSLLAVVDELEKHDNADVRGLAPTLRAVADYPLANLCFAAGGGQRFVPDEHLTTIQVAGLSMPEPGTEREHQSWPERLSVAVMFLIADFAKRLAQGRDRLQPKAIILDEAWMLTSTQQGRNLIPALARMGRSRNTAVILVSQNAGDLLDERVLNCVSSSFAFRSQSDGEIDAVLGLLGVANTPEHRRIVRSLGNGECVFRDLDGRVSTVQIDLVSEEVAQAFDTTPRQAPLEGAAS